MPGPCWPVAPVAIDDNETSVDLERRLAAVGAGAALDIVNRLATGPVSETAQDDAAATYAHRLERRDGQIDWTRPARAIHDQIRGLHPWPLAAATLRGKRVLLIRAGTADATAGSAAPGTIVDVASDALVVATGSGALRVLEIQPEGRPAMSVRAFLSGHRIEVGDEFAAVPLAGPAEHERRASRGRTRAGRGRARPDDPFR